LSTAQAQRLTFEAASIRRNLSSELGGTLISLTGRGSNGRVIKATPHQLILYAYDIREDQLVGGPGWIRTDAFDITAKAETPPTVDQARLMLQSLLEERFGLGVERELRERETYVLTRAERDWRPGPDLHRAPDGCKAVRPPDAATGTAISISLPPQPSSGARPSFGAACSTTAGLARQLERTLKTTIIDETGLTGMWDYVVAHSGLQPSTSSATVDDRPSFFVALQEQLGLKLERRKGQVSVLVIKSVHQPTEN
jgi:uncharacterized protein (TIGR03435 family)